MLHSFSLCVRLCFYVTMWFNAEARIFRWSVRRNGRWLEFQKLITKNINHLF